MACHAQTTKRMAERAMVTVFDDALGQSIKVAKRVPVLIHAESGKSRVNRKLDAHDIALSDAVNRLSLTYSYPIDAMLGKGAEWGDTYRSGYCAGVTHVHHFYTRRALITLSVAYNYARRSNESVRHYVLFTVEQAVLGMSRVARYVPSHYSQVNQYLSGTIYFGSLVVDPAITYILDGKGKRLRSILQTYQVPQGNVLVRTSSATSPLGENVVDYIFTDPPNGICTIVEFDRHPSSWF